MIKTTTTSLLGGMLLAGSVFAGEVAPVTTPAATSKFSSDIAVGYHSQYNWRGHDLGNDMVDATVNTAFTCPYTGLDISAGAWYASVKEGNFDELDLYASASKDLGFATASVGYIFYHFFDDADDAQEISFGLSKEFYGVETSLTYFWDIETDNGGYLEATASKSYDVVGGSLGLSAALGYSLEEGGLTHVTPKVSYAYALTETATLTPYVAYTVELDELENVYATPEDNEFFAGAVLSVTF